MYRCQNDYWGYCSDTPRTEGESKYITETKDGKPLPASFLAGNSCTLDPKECPYHRTFSVLVDPIPVEA